MDPSIHQALSTIGSPCSVRSLQLLAEHLAVHVPYPIAGYMYASDSRHYDNKATEN
jgi:hypothetical protein